MDEQERKFREAYAKKRAEEIARSHDPACLEERARQEAQDKIDHQIAYYHDKIISNIFYFLWYVCSAIYLGIFFSWISLVVFCISFYFWQSYFISIRELQNKKVPLWLKSPIQFLRQFKERLRQKK